MSIPSEFGQCATTDSRFDLPLFNGKPKATSTAFGKTVAFGLPLNKRGPAVGRTGRANCRPWNHKVVTELFRAAES